MNEERITMRGYLFSNISFLHDYHVEVQIDDPQILPPDEDPNLRSNYFEERGMM